MEGGAQLSRRSSRWWAFGRAAPGTAVPRVFIGRDTSKVARLTLADTLGRPRLALSVDSLGAARIEFLDEAGRVVSTVLPGAVGRGGR